MAITDPKKLLIFFHLTRAGGISLNSILLRHFAPEAVMHLKATHLNGKEEVEKLRNTPREALDKIEYLNGHMPFGLHEVFNRPYKYITMLRDPIEVIISDYYYTISRPRHEFYQVASKLTLKEFALSGLDLVNNYQTRTLSGYSTIAHTRSERLPENALELAKENLKKHFSVVGVTERFYETLLVLKKELGLKNIYYVQKNVNKNRPQSAEISEDVLRIIRANNVLDTELLGFANQLLDESIKKYGPEFKSDLRNFAAANFVYGGFDKIKQKRDGLKRRLSKLILKS